MTSGSFRLIERTGPNPGEIFELSKEITLLGRDVTVDVVLNDAEISRQHSRLTRTSGGYVLEDLGSTNGTFVNGERLAAPRVLNPGDLVGLGENITLTYDAVSAGGVATVAAPDIAQAAPPPPPPAQRAAAPAPLPPAPAQPTYEEEPSNTRRWAAAGCGCLVLLGACASVFWFMDSFYPDILYAPLRMFGF